MNDLAITNASGDLEGKSNSHRFFDTPKKVKFLQLAHRYWKERREMPRPEDLCEVIGVGIATFYRHLVSDDEFKAGWYEVKLLAKGELESVMYVNGKRPSGYMDRITWLRRHFPEEYNPEARIAVTHNTDVLDRLSKVVSAYITDAGKPIETTGEVVPSTDTP